MSSPNKNRLLITLPDFERVFRTIHGVLLNEQCDPTKACLYFGVFGAAILEKHHRLSAKAIVGAAGYNMGTSSNDVIAFANPQLNTVHSTEGVFHCWVEVDGWVFDFQSPLFKEMAASFNQELNIPRKMFQKPMSKMVTSLEMLHTPNSYWHEPNQKLGESLINNLNSKKANEDLLNICLDWYKPSPKIMNKSIGIGNQKGEVSEVKLSSYTLSGAW